MNKNKIYEFQIQYTNLVPVGSTCTIAALWETPDNETPPSPDCFGGLSLSVATLATLVSWESCRNIPVEVGHSDEQ